MTIDCSPCFAQFPECSRKVLPIPGALKDISFQKLRRTVFSKKADSRTVFPLESGNEKSGAAIGARSQVSTFIGKVSASGDALLGVAEICAVAAKGSLRKSLLPSTNQIRRLSGRFLNSCSKPLGHRIDASTGPLVSPRPKKSSLLC